jgi:hypothetical protein
MEYTTAYGNHKMTVPTREWTFGGYAHGFGGYLGWDLSTSNEADDMWTDLATLLAAFHLATTTFNIVTIYTMATPTSFALPQMIIPIAVVGINGATTQAKAVQQTWNMRSVAFGKFKLVTLDAPVGSNFNKILAASFGAPDLALVGELTDQAKAWSARDTTIPAAAISKTVTLNDKLRKEYGMT